MPPSQLKQLKSSLRESGVIGPQQSKKQKRQNAKTGAGAQNRNQREAALQAIRDRFNPFEIKASTKNVKFDYTSRDGGAEAAKNTARPGVTKSLGEERRRATLLREMERRNKVGGILDRRFGENDPTMTPEERAAERYARESQKKLRKESMFNLEEDDEDELQLTHMGQSLSFDDGPKDDFEDNDVNGSGDEQSDSETPRKRKRVFVDGEEEEDWMDGMGDEGEEEPGRKKSKHEVMKEVIAKSKFHKAERQQMREDDADLRDELDKGLPDLFDMLRGAKPPAPKPDESKDDKASMNPERAALLESKDPGKEYDQRLKQLTFDKRSQPTDRTKTAEEKIAEEAERLKKLEEDRVRRMRGEQESSDDEDDDNESGSGSSDEDGEGSDSEESLPDDAKAFGLQQPTQTTTRPDQGIEDEDDFIIDDDLVETRSDVSLSIGESASEAEDSDDDDDDEASDSEEEEGQGQDELINGLTLSTDDDKLAFTYPCPADHASFLTTIKDVPVEDLPTVVQRIRALHHPRLHSENKRKLGTFAEILIQHVSYMVEESEEEGEERPPFAIVENLLRHIHSLAKSHPENVSMAFRARLRTMATERPLSLSPSDLVILTGVAAIFPTSDHFHAIATPAHLCLARYLGQGSIETLSDLATGAYACSLMLQYQAVSKRFMPEFINYVLNALCVLSGTEAGAGFPIRKPEAEMQVKKATNPRKLHFWDIAGVKENKEEEVKASLITTFVTLLDTASDLWTGQAAYEEIFGSARAVLKALSSSSSVSVSLSSKSKGVVKTTLTKITKQIAEAHRARRPLFLHDHRPLAIKTAIPKFEESFNPTKHYDPDRERAESARLRSEYKRERKGAMRELRKDANFVAREQLRGRKERDAAYEKKYKRLVAEVQNEEGRAANEYERIKRLRRGQA